MEGMSIALQSAGKVLYSLSRQFTELVCANQSALLTREYTRFRKVLSLKVLAPRKRKKKLYMYLSKLT